MGLEEEKKYKSVITGYGYVFPDAILNNDDFSKTLDTSDEWIRSRTGICQRRIADTSKDSVASLGAKAALLALEKAELESRDVDAIILATTTPDHAMPATATKIQSIIKAPNAFAFDIQAACSGFLYGLSIADNFIKSGFSKNILVIGSEIMSRLLDWNDRTTCILFGDGAGAVLLQANEGSGSSRIFSTHLFSYGDEYYSLYVDESGANPERRGVVKMNGRQVYMFAVDNMAESVRHALLHNGLTVEDIDWFVAHQANVRIINSVAAKLGIPEEKIIVTLDRYANTSAASIPTSLAIAAELGKIKKGDFIAITAMGAGFTWGSAIIRW